MLIVGCGVDGDPGGADRRSASPTTHPLDQMVIAFEGSHSREEIKRELDRAMTLFGLDLTEENYSRAGSALVTMRRDYGTAEMDVLREMIRIGQRRSSLSFGEAAGLASFALRVEP